MKKFDIDKEQNAVIGGSITVNGNASITTFGDVKISCRKCGRLVLDAAMRALKNPQKDTVRIYCTCRVTP